MHKLKAIIKNILTEVFFRIQNDKKVVAKKPVAVHLSVTEDCCLRCKMCDIWKMEKKHKNLDYETAKKIIDKISNWLDNNFELTFAGGEPFMNTEFIKIIQYAKGKDFFTSTNSNGYLVNERLAQKIADSGLSRIFFSIDGEEKEHNFVRGREDSFQKVIKAITNLQKAKGKNKQPEIFINCVISNNNLHKIKRMVTLAKKLKVSGINFQVLMPNFASSYVSDWYKTNSLWPKKQQAIEKTIDELIKLKNEHPEFILNAVRDFHNFEKYLIDPKTYQETEKCFVGFNNFMIDTMGDMRLCYEMGTIGNILKEKPETLWINKRAKIHREKIVKCQKPCKLLPCNDVKIMSLLKNLLPRINQ